MKEEEGNELWARKLAARYLPGELFRWELYDRTLRKLLQGGGLWLDLGCGNTDFTAEYRDLAYGVGLDRDLPRNLPLRFVRAHLEHLPLRSGSVKTVSLRFVVEHLPRPEKLRDELRRVVAPGGRVLIITTNRFSLPVMLAQLMPERLKKLLVAWLFGVEQDQMQPVYHRWNTPKSLTQPPAGFELEHIEFVEALNWHRRLLFLFFLAVAVLTRRKSLRRLRSNILVIYRRVEEENEGSHRSES